jgi:hypothetical protein
MNSVITGTGNRNDNALQESVAQPLEIALVPSNCLILFFNSMWGHVPDGAGDGILTENCEITTDKRRLAEANAVVFHIPTLGSVRGMKKCPGQIWVGWSMECELHDPRMRDPSFVDQFDLWMTYRRDSDVVVPYYYPGLERAFTTLLRPKTNDLHVVYFNSSPIDRSGRNRLASELMNHIEVHSFGKMLPNRQLQIDVGASSKLETIAHYKFTLAFENAIARDYVTEKFYDPLIAGSIPVYLGAPNIEEFAPADQCFINASDFCGPNALAQHLLMLNEDADAYESLHAWRQQPLRRSFVAMLEKQQINLLLRLRDQIRKRMETIRSA